MIPLFVIFWNLKAIHLVFKISRMNLLSKVIIAIGLKMARIFLWTFH